MANSTGYVLAAGAIVAANDAVFVPMQTGKPPWQTLNWRIVPATAILAIVLGGFESVAPEFGKRLGQLVLLAALIVPLSKGGSALSNLAKVMGYAEKAT